MKETKNDTVQIIEENDTYRIHLGENPKMGNRKFYKKATLWETWNNFQDGCDLCEDKTEFGYEFSSHVSHWNNAFLAPKHYFSLFICDQESCITEGVKKYERWSLNASHYWEYKHIADTNINAINKLRELAGEVVTNPTELKVQKAYDTVVFGSIVDWNDEESQQIVKSYEKLKAQVKKS